jgi:uncharacterized protein YndB with AHSA1/START domain
MGAGVEYGSIRREVYVEATPEIVFEVISRPEHLREWWPDDASLDPAPGGVGELRWNDGGGQPVKVVPMTVVDADPPRLFVFRWAYEPGVVPDESNSFLVRFELTASGSGTMLRFTETGFREQGWEAAAIEEAYRDHGEAWDRFLPRLVLYAGEGVASR